jgi:ferredoxin
MAGGLAYTAPGGGHEMVAIDVATAGRYAVAVWKRSSLDLPLADGPSVHAAAGVVAGARRAMGTPTDMSNVQAALAAAPEHPGWAAVAERCLSCTNCTLVCPTCFCTSVVQRSDLDGTISTSERTWDSCFTEGFAKVAGGSQPPKWLSTHPPHQDRISDLRAYSEKVMPLYTAARSGAAAGK